MLQGVIKGNDIRSLAHPVCRFLVQQIANPLYFRSIMVERARRTLENFILQNFRHDAGGDFLTRESGSRIRGSHFRLLLPCPNSWWEPSYSLGAPSLLLLKATLLPLLNGNSNLQY